MGGAKAKPVSPRAENSGKTPPVGACTSYAFKMTLYFVICLVNNCQRVWAGGGWGGGLDVGGALIYLPHSHWLPPEPLGGR